MFTCSSTNLMGFFIINLESHLWCNVNVQSCQRFCSFKVKNISIHGCMNFFVNVDFKTRTDYVAIRYLYSFYSLHPLCNHSDIRKHNVQTCLDRLVHILRCLCGIHSHLCKRWFVEEIDLRKMKVIYSRIILVRCVCGLQSYRAIQKNTWLNFGDLFLGMSISSKLI